MKRCTKCGKEKPLGAFPPSKRMRSGRGSWCLACCHESKKIKYRNPPRTDGTKSCPGCKQERPVEHFNKDPGRADGLFYYCKICISKNPSRMALKLKQRNIGLYRCSKCRGWKKRDQFGERRDADGSRGGTNLSSHCKSCQGDYRSSLDRVPRNAGVKACARCNVEKQVSEFSRSKKSVDGLHSWCLACSRQYSAVTGKEWRMANPEEARVISRTRRLLRLNVPGSHTTEEWIGLCVRFGMRCVICGKAKTLEPDHIIPVTWIGMTSNCISNIQPACRLCNTRRGNRSAIDYRSTPFTGFGEAVAEPPEYIRNRRARPKPRPKSIA